MRTPCIGALRYPFSLTATERDTSMQITFTGPDGRLVTVADRREVSAGKSVNVALPLERRPAGSLIGAMKV